MKHMLVCTLTESFPLSDLWGLVLLKHTVCCCFPSLWFKRENRWKQGRISSCRHFFFTSFSLTLGFALQSTSPSKRSPVSLLAPWPPPPWLLSVPRKEFIPRHLPASLCVSAAACTRICSNTSALQPVLAANWVKVDCGVGWGGWFVKLGSTLSWQGFCDKGEHVL